VPGTWYAWLTISLAVVAGATLVGRPAGLPFSLMLLVLLGAGAAVAPRHDGWTYVWWLCAGGLALMPALRHAVWVETLSVFGAVGLALAASDRTRSWLHLARLPVTSLGGLITGPGVLVGVVARKGSGAALRGGAIAVVLVGCFGSLFVAADSAFGALAEDVLPDFGEQWVTSLGITLLFACVAGALPVVAFSGRAAAAAPPQDRLGRTETRIALFALVALFAAFVVVQAATLFGGDAFVQRTSGLTYAEHARRGFGLLLIVAAMTLAVIACAARWAQADRWLLGALCLLTVVVLASAWHRLDLYVDAYGATRAREFAMWSILWLGGVFVLILDWPLRRRLPRILITWSAVLGLAFGLSNPDARIAAGAKDPAYIKTLSEDAR
jgi:hypothetical protein